MSLLGLRVTIELDTIASSTAIMMSPVYANEVHISWEEPAPLSITILLMNGADQHPPSM